MSPRPGDKGAVEEGEKIVAEKVNNNVDDILIERPRQGS